MNTRSKKPLVVAIAVFGVIIVTAVVAILSMSVECPYCHNSDASVKGNCVLRRLDETCREDYYPEHHNKKDCGWCQLSGSMSLFSAMMD